MAINKKLIHFQTKSAFNTELNAGNILDTSIVFIKDTQEIWTHGQLYSCYTDGSTISALKDHLNDFTNPHKVTKTQVGLNNVDNTSDEDKPLSNATKLALEEKVDVVRGKGLSTNDFTNALKDKLDGIEKKANNYSLPTASETVLGGVMVDSALNSTSANPIQNKVIYSALDEIKANMSTGLEEALTYGVQFDMTVADPHLTRIGNIYFHKSLPIQSQLKGCIAQGGKVIYWLNQSDWRFRKEAVTQSVRLTVTNDTYTIGASVFSTLQYDKQWVKVDGVACQISSINTSTKKATLRANEDLKALSLKSSMKSIELGAVLNGYDGTVRVYCPAFYIKSTVNDNIATVRLSTIKLDNTYTYQPEVLVDAYRSTVLNTVPENMGYLSTLAINSAISVVNTNTYCRGGGNRSANDQYLATDLCRTDLGKPRTNISRAAMRTYSRNANSQMLSYDQYKNIFYWLYVVEYANFNSQEAYNKTLTNEGYRQGGMGNGFTNILTDIWDMYNERYPITPCGYGNTLGNGTGLLRLETPTFTSSGLTLIIDAQIARWRGFDNPFGDIYTNLDGIIIDADADNHPNNMNYVYTCQDASKYDDILNDSYVKVGEEIHQDGYTKSFDLGDAAHIIPHVMGGNTTQYICDYHLTGSKDKTLRTLIVGGHATAGASAGLGYFDSHGSVSSAWTTLGFRTVSSFVSSDE